METEPAEQLRRVAWNASPEDSLMAVAGYVLASDETVARWRGHLGIVAEPAPTDGIYRLADTMIRERDDAIRRLTERVGNLEGLEASRRAAKDAVTDGDELPDGFLCIYCSKALTLGDLTEEHVYCRSCWAKRLAVTERMAADTVPVSKKWTCHDCGTKPAVQGVVADAVAPCGHTVDVGYCRDCWAKREKARRVAGRV